MARQGNIDCSGMEHEAQASQPESERPRRVVCKLCGAALEVVVSFSGKIVWPVDPDRPDFGAESPMLRGDTKSIRVVCSADVMHACGYSCIDGVLVETPRTR